MDTIKVIESFQFPMDSGSTPYNISEFSPEVEDICDSEKTFISALQDSTWKNASSAEAAEKQINASRSRLRIAKCIVVGDISVGKTCLVHRLVDKVYANNLKATTGVDFEVQQYEILGRPFTLQIWDTAGHPRFQNITRSYYRGAHAVLVCFDLSNFASFLKVKQWLDEVLENQGKQDTDVQPFIFLVGTKLDLFQPQDGANGTTNNNSFNSNNITINRNHDSNSTVNGITDNRNSFRNSRLLQGTIHVEHEARKVAEQLGAEYWQISSQTGANVDELFDRIACLTFDRYMSAAAEQTKRDLEASKTIFYTKIRNTNNVQNNNNNNKSAKQQRQPNGSAGSASKRKKQAPGLPLNNSQNQNIFHDSPSSRPKRQKRSWVKQAIDIPLEMFTKFTNCLSEQFTNRKGHKNRNKVAAAAAAGNEYEFEERRLSQKSPISNASEKLQSKRKAFRCFNIKCTFAVEP